MTVEDIKVGDHVKSTKYIGVAGVVQEITPCSNSVCSEDELTLDAPGNGTRYYYHVGHFVKIPKSREASR